MPSVNITSAYVGEIEETLFHLMKYGNQAVEKGSVHVEPGVSEALFIPRLNSAEDQLQVREEDPTTPSDSFTYDERQLTPNDAMFFDLVNPRYFESVWRPFQPNGPLVDKVDNPTIQAAIINETMKTVGQQLGKIIWQGDSALLDTDPLHFFDGYIKIFKADGAIIAPPLGPIDSSNVLSVMAGVESSIPDEIWEDPNVVYHMNTKDYRALQAAGLALDYKGHDITELGAGRYAGREVRYYTGFPKDKILVTKATAGKDSNLWAGIDTAGDEENVKIERYRPESERFIVKVLFKYGVQTPNPTEAVLYEAV